MDDEHDENRGWQVAAYLLLGLAFEAILLIALALS